MQHKPDYYVGIMSGTSLDGIDAVLVEFLSDRQLRVVERFSSGFEVDLKCDLTALLKGFTVHLMQLGQLDVRLGIAYSQAVIKLLECAGVGANEVVAIGCHGQTIYHDPRGSYPFTMQLGDANTLAARTGIRVISDFRRMDVAYGGNGAPLTPAFHQQFFADAKESRVIVNLGGIANITRLSADQHEISGFDTGPANCLIDLWCQAQRAEPFDRDGLWAKGGRVVQALLERMLQDPYFKLAPPKSTGKELFNLQWLERQLLGFVEISAQDVQATLLALTVESLARHIERYAYGCESLYLCGGGARNEYLIACLGARLPDLRIAMTEELGIESQWVEAIAFAWFARRRVLHQAANMPSVTGASRHCILGASYLP